MSLVRYFLPTDRIRVILTKRKLYGLDYFLATVFGGLTPFCSCSSIPLFIGFLEAGIPLGVTLAFLITSPLINEVAIGLFIGIFGWKITLLYIGAGIVIGMVGGYILGKMHLQRFVDATITSNQTNAQKSNISRSPSVILRITSKDAFSIFKSITPYVLIGVGIGALIHGFIPTGFFEQSIAQNTLFAVPLSVLIAVPMYANASGVIPIVESLVAKGIPLGTALAFMMAIVGLSFPEAMILKRVMKLPLLFAFFGTVTLGIVIIGYAFNALI